MKKFFLAAIMVFAAVAMYAQDNSVKGTWKETSKIMGCTATEIVTFSDNASGSVTSFCTFELGFSFFGFKIVGKLEASRAGTFVYEGNKLVQNWDPESTVITVVEPAKATMGGEVVEDVQMDIEKSMDEIIAEINEKLVDEYTVEFKKGNLVLTYYDEKGKANHSTYKRQ